MSRAARLWRALRAGLIAWAIGRRVKEYEAAQKAKERDGEPDEGGRSS